MSDSPSPLQEPRSNRLSLWTLVLMAVGAPPAVLYSFRDWALANPWPALTLLLLYEIGVLLAGFVLKVWHRLEKRWIDRVADRLDTWACAFFSNHRRRYLQHLVYLHRNFDVKGLTTQGVFSLELQQIFVDLSVAPTPTHQTSPDPIRQLPKALREGRHSIGDYLRPKDDRAQNLAIIGAPGCGKTTLLKHMTLDLAMDKRRRKSTSAFEALPILLFLRDHGEAVNTDPNLSLVQAVQNSLRMLQPTAPSVWLEKELSEGRCLVMLDGLDEIADPEIRKGVMKWVQDQMTVHGNNRFIITSRPFGYRDNPLSGVTVLEVRPLSSEQVKCFVHNWYLANEIGSQQKDDTGVRMSAREGAENLLTRLRGAPVLSELSVNPLLLTMITTVHLYRGSLPDRRVELYDEILEVFLGKRRLSRGLDVGLSASQKQRVLEPLAFYMMCERKREVLLEEGLTTIIETLAMVSPETTGEEFLKSIEDTSGLLLERESGVYSFAHLTFQECLAACHARQQKLEDELVTRVDDSWWHETIRLYAAQTDATPVISACLAGDRPSVSALVLAIECLEEACEVQPKVRSKLATFLEQGVEDPNSVQRQLVAEAMLRLRLRQMMRIDEDRYVDPSLINCAEYQLFLDERQAVGEDRFPDHWLDNRFPTGQGREPVAGVRSSDAVSFCEWLMHREGGEWRYRLPIAGEFEARLRNDNIMAGSTAHVGYWVSFDSGAVYTIAGMPMKDLTDWYRDVDLDMDVGSTLNRKIARDLRFKLDHAPPVDYDLDVDHERDLKRARDRALAGHRVLAGDFGPYRTLHRTHHGARDLVFDLARDLQHDVEHSRKRAIDRIPSKNLDRALTHQRDIERGHSRARYRTSELKRTEARARELRGEFGRVREIARDVDRAAELVSERDFLNYRLEKEFPELGNKGVDQRALADFLCGYICYCALVMVEGLWAVRHTLTTTSWFGRGLTKEIGNRIQDLIDMYYDLYIDFAALKLRIEEQLPAFEGIRIVKERTPAVDALSS